MPHERIMNEWQSFAKAVLPRDVHAVQVTEMRRAFFAGAQAMMAVMMTVSGEGQ